MSSLTVVYQSCFAKRMASSSRSSPQKTSPSTSNEGAPKTPIVWASAVLRSYISNISLEEAYRILNLDPKKKYNKDQILTSYKKIMKKIHPDVSPELTRLASIVNEAKDVIIKDIS